MRIANITEEGRFGGPQARIAAVAGALQEYQVETVVVHPEAESGTFAELLREEEITARQVRLHRLTRDMPAGLRWATDFVPEVLNLRSVLREADVRLTHVNGAWQLKGAIAGKLADLPVVWHLNDTQVPSVVKLFFHAIATGLADGIIAAGQRTWRYYVEGSRLEALPSKVIQAPVDTVKFDPARTAPSPTTQRVRGLSIVTVGTVNPHKDLKTLLRAAARVSESVEAPLHFYVVGPVYDSQADYGAMLKRTADELGCENVTFTGFSDQIPGILKGADIYVCSSRNEASPTSVWEAMSMALPVVSTDVGDVAQFIRRDDGKCGFVVPVGDWVALADRIKVLADHSELRRRFGARARRIACEELDLRVCARRHASFYREIFEVKTGVDVSTKGK